LEAETLSEVTVGLVPVCGNISTVVKYSLASAVVEV